MEHGSKQQGWLLVLAGLGLGLGGCGLSQADLDKAKAVAESLARTSTLVTAEWRTYEALKASPEYSAVETYDEREQWSNTLAAAERASQHAHAVYQQEVQPLLDQNDGDEALTLQAKLGQVESAIKEAQTKAKTPGKRLAFITEAREHAAEWCAKAEVEAKQISARFNTALGKHEAARRDHPGQQAQIDQRFALVRQTNELAGQQLAVVRAEHAKGEALDCLFLGDNCQALSAAVGTLTEQADRYEREVAELYRDYSKILVDMRIDYAVKVVRTSWDEDSDWTTDTDHGYAPRTVSEEVFDYFDDLVDDVLLASYGNWGGLSVKIDRGKWDGLGLDAKESWPGWSHDQAEYWLADLPVSCYHKYLYVEDSQRREGEWEAVSLEEYNQHWDDLGMALVTKPAGLFESEVNTQATPPGLAQVGNPKYGQWQKDSSGHSFWDWYGPYLFYSSLFGNNQSRYSRADWDDWDRNYRGRSAYYGSEREGARYGTYGSAVRGSSRYAQSTFSSRGGFQEVEREVKAGRSAGASSARQAGSSVRGAGPAGRSGGPGGGGK